MVVYCINVEIIKEIYKDRIIFLYLLCNSIISLELILKEIIFYFFALKN